MSENKNTLEESLSANTGKVEGEYDRWSLKDEASLDYGYFNKTGGAGISEADADTSFYLTTAINYTNGPAHMGHAYEATTSDALCRYARLKGDGPVYFLTGSDEHGQKIANTAAGENKQPIDICDKVSGAFNTVMIHCNTFNCKSHVHVPLCQLATRSMSRASSL